jgi:uncharacterized protein (TIGR02996 family)
MLGLWVKDSPMTAETEEHRLIEAIRENPKDFNSRLEYAGLLESRGAKDRAELIRVNVELENQPTVEKTTQLQEEHAGLLPQCHKEWKDLFRQLGGDDVYLENGYPFSIIITPKNFITNAQSLLATAPVEALCPTMRHETRHRELRELVKCPDLARLPELNLGRQGIGNEGVKTLTSSPFLANLKTLKLDFNNIEDRGAAALAKYAWNKLTCLDLGMNPIGARGLRALAESAIFKSEMRIRVNDFDGTFDKFQEWVRTQRFGGPGSGEKRGR